VIARQERESLPTVGNWRARFVMAGLERPLDESKPDVPCTIGNADVELVIVATSN
jgi:hypothetical protein